MAVFHTAASFLKSYVEEVIPVITGPPFLQEALKDSIKNGLHASAFTPDMVGFVLGYMQQGVQDGFSILLPVVDTLWIFG